MVSNYKLNGMVDDEIREKIEFLEDKKVLSREERQDLRDYQDELSRRGRNRFEMPDMTA